MNISRSPYVHMHPMELLESRVLFAVTIDLLKDIGQGNTSGFLGQAIEFEGKLYFSGNNAKGIELWTSDGTKGGTEILKNINGEGSSVPHSLVAAKSQFFFIADDGEAGAEPWVSNGKKSRTEIVIDVNSGTSSSGPVEFVTSGKFLLFAADPGSGGHLLVSSGKSYTQVGVPNAEDVGNPLAGMKGKFYFGFNSGKDSTTPNDDNYELWSCETDGSNAEEVKNIAPGKGASSNPSDALVVDDLLFFTAYPSGSANSTRKLFRTNGTEAGTKQIATLGLQGGAGLDHQVAGGDEMFFSFRNASGSHLGKSDGQKDGTFTLASFPGSTDSITNIVRVKDKVFFNATGAGGNELYVVGVDGTGLKRVDNINPGATGSFINNMTRVGKWVYFSAFTTKKGTELWRSDGNKTTCLTNNLNPGTASTSPNSLVNVNGTLFFGGTTSATGQELFAVKKEKENPASAVQAHAPSSTLSFSLVPVGSSPRAQSISSLGVEDLDDSDDQE